VGLGWHALELFGCDRRGPWVRIDRQGLLWLLDGNKLTTLTADTAVSETPTGTRQTYHRTTVDTDDVVLAWELRATA
jgi:hypothetical protein